MTNTDPERVHSLARLAALVSQSLKGVDAGMFLGNRDLVDATAYRLQHIGEAANKLSAELRARYPDVPWRAMVGMRNILAHAYDLVAPETVWKAAHERLDAIIAMCRAELGE